MARNWEQMLSDPIEGETYDPKACGACGQLYTDQHADSEGLHFLIYCDESNAEPSTATEYDNGTSLTLTN